MFLLSVSMFLLARTMRSHGLFCSIRTTSKFFDRSRGPFALFAGPISLCVQNIEEYCSYASSSTSSLLSTTTLYVGFCLHSKRIQRYIENLNFLDRCLFLHFVGVFLLEICSHLRSHRVCMLSLFLLPFVENC